MQRIIESIESLKQSVQQSQVSLSIELQEGESVKVSLRLVRQQVKAIFSNESEAMRIAIKESWDQLQRQVAEKGLEADLPEFQSGPRDSGDEGLSSRDDQEDSWDQPDGMPAKQNRGRKASTNEAVVGSASPERGVEEAENGIRRYA
jgi:hypothetical protein